MVTLNRVVARLKTQVAKQEHRLVPSKDQVKAAIDLPALMRGWLKTHTGKMATQSFKKNRSLNTCDHTARWVSDYLKDQGVRSQGIFLVGRRGQTSQAFLTQIRSRLPDYQINAAGKRVPLKLGKGSLTKYLTHVVLKVGNVYLDVTGCQFDESIPRFRLLTDSELKAEWDKALPISKVSFKDSNYGVAPSYDGKSVYL